MATVRAAPRARGLAGKSSQLLDRNTRLNIKPAMPHNVLGVMDNQKSVSILSLPTSARVIDPEKLPYVVCTIISFLACIPLIYNFQTSWSACLDNQVTLEDNTGGIFIQVCS